MASPSNANEEGKRVPAAFGSGGFVLPEFIERRPDGVFVDTGKLPSAEVFQHAVDRAFSSGYCFGGLDYPLFLHLLYDLNAVRSVAPLRLANEFREFPQARQALYKAVKIINGEAFYMFEPVPPESTVSVGSACLDPDEFVADMWRKGVRFGIDLAAVATAIRGGRCERVVVARAKEPAAGQDAFVKEESDALHQDNTPRRLEDGRVDLGQFKNRFPQIKKGTLLLKKMPYKLGQPGRTVAGQLVLPPTPRDVDLASLAGEGTAIENLDGYEHIVAVMDGFLNLDNQTKRVAITEKIVNRDGVSARTTGNLVLTGDLYEEYGEVQEGRAVEGKGLIFHANVFGKVLSSGGDIVLHKNLVGGSAMNHGGSIAVAGLASNALMEAPHGVIRLKQAENSILMAQRVEVKSARNCIVLADEVDIEVAEGCAIAGKRVHVGTGMARNGEDMLVSMVMPDLSGIDQAQAKERGYLNECDELLAGLKRGVDSLMSQPEVRTYFTIAGQIHRKEITLTPEQQGKWQQMCSRLIPSLKRIAQGREDMKSLEREIQAVQERIAAFEAEKGQAVAGMECQIGSIQGEVAVRTLVQPSNEPPLAGLSPRELKQRLRAPDPGSRRLFAGNTGLFSWRPE